MLKVTFELHDDVDVNEFLAEHKDNKRVKKITVSGKKKSATKAGVVSEPMTDYYSKGKQLSVKQFKTRIKKAEQDIKEGRFYTAEEMLKNHEEWKKKHGLTK